MNQYIDELKKHGIKYLYHFTSILNLSSIFRYGILSVSELKKNGIKYKYSDRNRNDNELDKISLSLNDFNKRMFYLKNDNTNRMIIFELTLSLLLEGEPYFCYKNAADTEISEIMKMDSRCLQTTYAIEKMFNNGILNEQAEILFRGIIDLKYINKIIVTSFLDKMVILDILKENNLNIPVQIINKGSV